MATLSPLEANLSSLPLTGVVVVVLLALLPMALLTLTSFLKVSVVLSILRSALGAQGVPSVAVTGVLSLLLTAHIMRPVGEEMARAVVLSRQLQTPASPQRPSIGERLNLAALTELMTTFAAVSTPLERFLRRQSGLRERRYFSALASGSAASESLLQELPAAVAEELLPGEGIFSLVPAFVFSELTAACAIGVRIYLPFLVIDLVVASLLVGVGMSMVSPVTVALPLKLLLFVSVDGWLLLADGLVRSYAAAI